MVIDRFARDRRLKAIGFNSYKEYLKSDLWKSIRENVFDVKGKMCAAKDCTAPATQIHHTRYKMEELGGRNLRHLHPLCRDCHYKIEFDGKKKSGRRRTLYKSKKYRLFDKKPNLPGNENTA